MNMGFVILSFTFYLTTVSRSLHIIIERKMILRIVTMNCYRFCSTPMKPAHFVKESTIANWNGFNVAFVSNGFMNLVSISDLLFIYLDTYKILSFKLNWNLYMLDFLNSRLFFGRFLRLYFVKDDWIEDIMGFSHKIYTIVKYIFYKIWNIYTFSS